MRHDRFDFPTNHSMKIQIQHHRKARTQQLPVRCPDCDQDTAWRAVSRSMPQEFRGGTLDVQSGCHECPKCGFRLLTDQDRNALRLATFRAYQEASDLLTAEEIVAARERMGWSQAELARKSGLGIASIKRWETGRLIQTAGNDRMLRTVLAPALNGGFNFLTVPMGHVQITCFTEEWEQGWAVQIESETSLESWQSKGADLDLMGCGLALT